MQAVADCWRFTVGLETTSMSTEGDTPAGESLAVQCTGEKLHAF
jgi:hypothetical protein